jgi:thioredoxin 1
VPWGHAPCDHERPRRALVATIVLTKENFESTLEKGGTLLIDWWAPWCGPCRNFAPIFEKASETHPDVTFAKVNTDEQQELGATFQIDSIPTIMVFRDKILLFAQGGALPGHVLEGLIEQVTKLDMDEVRKKIAEDEKKGAAAD